MSYDAPHIVDEVGVIELHAPTFPLWRETTEHQKSCIVWQEGFERVFFNIDVQWIHLYALRLWKFNPK
jgi:hypothetical protein